MYRAHASARCAARPIELMGGMLREFHRESIRIERASRIVQASTRRPESRARISLDGASNIV
jgi:hypothetical protein